MESVPCHDLTSSSLVSWKGGCCSTRVRRLCPALIATIESKEDNVWRLKPVRMLKLIFFCVRNSTSLCIFRFSAFSSSSTFSAFSAADLYRTTWPSSLVTWEPKKKEIELLSDYVFIFLGTLWNNYSCQLYVLFQSSDFLFRLHKFELQVTYLSVRVSWKIFRKGTY